jgi:hypothetical protein
VSTQPVADGADEPTTGGATTTQSPLESPFADAASPFKRTEAPLPVFAGPPPEAPLQPATQSTWVTYRSQINFGLSMLAYLMVLVGTITVVEANPGASWRLYVAALPAVPAVVGLIIFVRLLMRLDDIQARIQVLSFGTALGATALLTFGYAFFEGVGLPHLPPAYVLPLMAIFWGLGTAFFTWRYMWRYRRRR